MAKGKALNLDELYGKNDPVVVIFQDKEYELLRPDSWTPEVYAKYVSLQKTMTEKELLHSMETPKAFDKLTTTLHKILEIISPELAAMDLSLGKQSAIIEHYASIVFPEELSTARKMVASKNQTGA